MSSNAHRPRSGSGGRTSSKPHGRSTGNAGRGVEWGGRERGEGRLGLVSALAALLLAEFFLLPTDPAPAAVPTVATTTTETPTTAPTTTTAAPTTTLAPTTTVAPTTVPPTTPPTIPPAPPARSLDQRCRAAIAAVLPSLPLAPGFTITCGPGRRGTYGSGVDGNTHYSCTTAPRRCSGNSEIHPDAGDPDSLWRVIVRHEIGHGYCVWDGDESEACARSYE